MKMCRGFFFLAVLAGFAIAGLAPPGRADFEVQLSYNGGVVTIDGTTGLATASGGASLNGATINGTAVSGTSYSFTVVNNKITISGLTVDPNGVSDSNTGGFNISASISKSNSPGNSTVGTISSSGLGILNQSGVSGNGTLTMVTGSTGFTSPATNPVVLESTVSVSADATNSASASVVFNSYLNTNNSQFGTGSPGFGSPTVNLGPIAPGASASTPNPPGFVSATGSPGATPYSIVQVGKYTLANGDDFFDGSTGTSVVPTPAPGGLMLAIGALPALGVGAWFRRRSIAMAAA